MPRRGATGQGTGAVPQYPTSNTHHHVQRRHRVQLTDLLTAVPVVRLISTGDQPVSGVTYDSRLVTPGMVFVAIPGFHMDGAHFVGDARDRGAAAVVVAAGTAVPATWVAGGCTWVEVADTRAALSALAARWHGDPGMRPRVIGVTGTDGKTTTSYMTSAVLEAAGFSTGLMGTVQFKVGDVWEDNSTRQTTPEAPEVQELLARMRDNGVTHAIIESTSHGLALHKLDHCFYDVAVVTNITEDHLDFHHTVDAYRAAKRRLFELAARSVKLGPRFAVLNADDSSFAYLHGAGPSEEITYGIDAPADLHARIDRALPTGSHVTLEGRWGTAPMWVPMAGRFNVSNALAAAAVALGHGIALNQVCEAMARFTGVPGRMITVGDGHPFTVIVDYAHTGHAFRKLLNVLRPLTTGRVIAVFGSAGERAPERRAGMGEVAAELTDFAVLTNEDPRFEDPDRIIADIAGVLAGAGRREGHDFIRVPDRRGAIRAAFDRARPGDLVVLAGKGHEQSIIAGDHKLPWDEQRVAEEELGLRAAGGGRP